MNARSQCSVFVSGPLALALGTALAIASGCGRSDMDCPPGSEHCPCLLDGTCNDGLTCASDVCASTATSPIVGGAGGTMPATSAGGATGSTSAGGITGATSPGGSTGTTGSGCGPVSSQCSPIATSACGTCAGSCCCSEFAACVTNATCSKVLQCAIACGLATSCLDNCVASSPSGNGPVSDLYHCMSSNCLSLCQ